MKQVLVYTPVGDYRGGAEKSFYTCVEAMLENGFNVTVITSCGGEFIEDLNQLGAKTIITNISENCLCIGRRNILKFLLVFIKLNFLSYKIIAKQKPKLVYCNDSLSLQWCILSLAFKLKRPSVIVHERLADVRPAHKFCFSILKKKFSVIFTSEFMKQKISSHFTTYQLIPTVPNYLTFVKAWVCIVKTRSFVMLVASQDGSKFIRYFKQCPIYQALNDLI